MAPYLARTRLPVAPRGHMVKTEEGSAPVASSGPPPSKVRRIGTAAPEASEDAPFDPMAQEGPAPSIYVSIASGRVDSGLVHITGEYVKDGTNHGRPCFKKVSSTPNSDVFVYYWDERDGEAWRGWWFANQVGGDNIFVNNVRNSPVPPQDGWVIPFADGEVETDLVLRNGPPGYGRAGPGTKGSGKGGGKHNPPAAPRQATVEDVLSACLDAEADGKAALELARELVEAGVAAGQQSNKALELLSAQAEETAIHLQTLNAMLRRGYGGDGAVQEEIQKRITASTQLRKQLEDEQHAVREAIAARATLLNQARRKREMAALGSEADDLHEKILDPAREKITAAEDFVEQVCIAAEILEASEMGEGGALLREVEQHVQTAASSIRDAYRSIAERITACNRLNPKVRLIGKGELQDMQLEVGKLQQKLEPYKNVRHTFERRTQALKILDDLAGKVTDMEIEVEKAKMVSTRPGDDDDAEWPTEAKQMTAAATKLFRQIKQHVDSKLRQADQTIAVVKEQSDKLQERIKEAEEKLVSVDESRRRVESEALLKEISDKIVDAEDQVQAVASSAWLEAAAKKAAPQADKDGTSTDDVDLRDDGNHRLLLKQMDDASQAATKSVSEARAFVMGALPNVAKLSEALRDNAEFKQEFNGLQARLKDAEHKLAEMVKSSRQHLDRLKKEAVAQLVESSEKVVADLEKALDTAHDDPQGVSEVDAELMATKEKAADKLLKETRDFLDESLAELRGKSVGSTLLVDLRKMQARATACQATFQKLSNQLQGVSGKSAAAKIVSATSNQLQLLQAETAKARQAAQPLLGHDKSEIVDSLKADPLVGQEKVEAIEAQVVAVHKRSVEVASEMESEINAIANVKSGPMAVGRTQLVGQRMKVIAEQSKLQHLLRQVATAKKLVLKQAGVEQTP